MAARDWRSGEGSEWQDSRSGCFEGFEMTKTDDKHLYQVMSVAGGMRDLGVGGTESKLGK